MDEEILNVTEPEVTAEGEAENVKPEEKEETKLNSKELKKELKQKKKEERAQKRKIVMTKIIAALLVMITVALNVFVSYKLFDKKKSKDYDYAVKLFEAGHYDCAKPIFEDLKKYRESAQFIGYCDILITAADSISEAAKIEIPDTIYMKELNAAIEKYLPYCGKFMLKSESESFTSDFSFSDGEVYWKIDNRESDSRTFCPVCYVWRINEHIEFFDEKENCKVTDLTVEDVKKAEKYLLSAEITFLNNDSIHLYVDTLCDKDLISIYDIDLTYKKVD